ncbi:hypothetical protein AB8O64_02540 [Streptomyces sp. QH1-20]|uniref:hypothetical protein n=1 Tax=Streptomyces sp. QH1-20 TaxID=3240934 RepID=UPI003510E475
MRALDCAFTEAALRGPVLEITHAHPSTPPVEVVPDTPDPVDSKARTLDDYAAALNLLHHTRLG